MRPAVAIAIGVLGGFLISGSKLVDNVWSASNAASLVDPGEKSRQLRRRVPFDGEYMVAQAIPTETAPAATTVEPKVDETALRYFAAKGDTRRLEAEIARLRALYPSWTPPENPLAVRELTDPQLDAMWKLYSEGKLAELRKAIGDRQTAEIGWQPPADLIQRLQVAEAREQLINASKLRQYDTVIRLGSANPSLLTCGDVDVLWRVAEAFASTKRSERAKDTYLYVLQNCEKSEERVATIQKAMSLLARSDVDQLLAFERQSAEGKGEFDAIRVDIARSSLAAGSDPQIAVPQSDVALVEKLAADGPASDALLLGWYYLHRDKPSDSEKWFRKAFDREQTAVAAEGLSLSLLALDRPAEAEDILYKWRDTSDDRRKSYLAAVANLLSQTPPPPIASDILQRMVAEIFAAKDAVAAQQLGWYADSLNQLQTAALWFQKSLDWKPDEEAAAYGLALMRWKLGDKAGVEQIQAAWAGRSDRIPTVGQPQRDAVPPAIVRVPPQGAISAPPPVGGAYAPPQASNATTQNVQDVRTERTATAPKAAARGERASGCNTVDGNHSLSPARALAKGWCLMESKRPIEAAEAFQRALEGPAKIRAEAAYGQSLAYLQAGLSDRAAIAATKGNIDGRRAAELRSQLLSTQAVDAYEKGRYHEALIALDERARLVGEQNDLLVLRGYSYLNLRRYGDAERVFRAAALTGNREAMRGLNELRAAREPRGSQN